MSHEDDHSGVGPDADLLPDVRSIAADLRTVFVTDPKPEAAAAHVAAMTSAALATAVPPRRRRRAAVAGAVAAAGVALTGGLAAAGVLPAPVQDGISRFVHPIGIDFPRSGDAHRGGGSPDADDDQGTIDDTIEPTSALGVDDGDHGGEPPAAGESPSVTAPGQVGEPGASSQAPGADPIAPGQADPGPGRSQTAPGQTGAGGNNKPAVPPGQVDNPGQGKDGKDVVTTTTVAPAS